MPTLGRRAEKKFDSWMGDAGIASNYSVEDWHGWDYKIEFPHSYCPDDEDRPLDKRGSDPKCLIQVKGVGTDTNRRSVSLSNWRDLATDPHPTFFAIVRFSGRSVRDVYLVHVGEDYITDVLRRLRKLSSEGNEGAISDKTMDVSWGEENKIERPYGEKIAENICEIVGPNLKSYSAKKIGVLNSAGYDEFAGKLQASVAIPEEYEENPMEALIDFGLGLVSELEVRDGYVAEERFDTETVKSALGGGTLEVREIEPANEGIVRLRYSDKTSEIRLPCKLYSPSRAVASRVDVDKLKFRLAVPYCDLIVTLGSSAEFSFSLPSSAENVDLAGLDSVANLILFLDQAGRSDIDHVDLYFDDRWLANFVPQGSLDSYFLTLAEIIRDATLLARHFGIKDDVTVTLASLVEQKTEINIATDAIGRPKSDTVFRFQVADTPIEEELCLPITVIIRLEATNLLIGVAYFLNTQHMEEVDGEFVHTMRPSRVSLEEHFVLEKGEHPPRSVTEVLEEIAGQYGEGRLVYAWWHDADEEE